MAYDAGRVVAQLEARNDQFDARMLRSADITDQSMSRVERSAASAERAISRSSSIVVASQGQVAQSTRNLGFQISDVGQQLSGGQSPFVIFGQQAPQFVQAFDEIAASGARVGQVLRAVALPGILAVISVLATLIERHYQASQAANAQNDSAKSLSSAIADLGKALDQTNSSSQRAIFLTYAKAQADREAAIQTRKRIVAELSLADALLQKEKGISRQGGERSDVAALGVQRMEANQIEIRARLARATNDVAAAEANVVKAGAPIARNRALEALDAQTLAANRYERQLDLLYSKLKRDGDQGAYQRGIAAAARLKDATIETARATAAQSQAADRGATASRGHAVTLNLQASGAREAAAAQRELETALGSLIQRYDPLSAAAAQYAQELKNIAALEKAGKLGADQAGRLREGAGSAYRKTRADAFNLPIVEGLRPEAARDEKEAQDAARAQEEAARDAERASQAIREQNVRSLANIYEDVFTRSSGQVWENFKRDGLRALAVILAQATITSFSKGGGGLGSLLGNISSAAGSYFGGARAMGGPVSAGTTYLVGERGPELLRMGNQGGVITPNSQIAAASAVAARSASSSAVPQPQQVDVRVFLSDDIDARIDGRSAGVSVQVMRGMAPAIVDAAVVKTFSEIRKPGL